MDFSSYMFNLILQSATGFFYDKTESYIEEEKLYEVLYEMEV